MSLKLIDTDNNDGQVLDFIRLLKDVTLALDTLGQIQKCAGGISMENRASTTFENLARLESRLGQIEYNRLRDNNG